MTGHVAPNTIWEFYDLLTSLEGKLTAGGADVWAMKIARTVAAGATSGEILGNVSLDLDELVRSGVPQRLGLCPEVDLARRFANAALGWTRRFGPLRPGCR